MIASSRLFLSCIGLLIANFIFPTWILAQPQGEIADQPPAGLLRFPAISAEHVAFGYATQLWVVPRAGGEARPIAFPQGTALMPAFSPDGRQLAFVANYDGQRDIYVVPVNGGIPRRLTTHPGDKQLHCWTPDGQHLVYSTSVFSSMRRKVELYRVSISGELPEKLPVAYGTNASFSSDGEWMAFMTHSRDTATWKRYRGGQATDIWLFNLQTFASRKITDWEGTDTAPMWHGDSVYYLSDEAEPYRLNFWRFDLTTGERHRLTDFAEFDIKYPSIGPGPNGGGEIVFLYGRNLKVLDLETLAVRTLEITIPGALPIMRPQTVSVSDLIQNRSISPTGTRVLVEARGDLWNLPAQRGSARNLTRSSGSAERQPAWSPDGKWIIFSSDASGEYQLNLLRADGTGDPVPLTDEAGFYYYTPNWSPDSKHFVVATQKQELLLGTISEEGQPPTELRKVGYNADHHWISTAWSPDSKWVVAVLSEATEHHPLPTTALWVINVESGDKQRLTSGFFAVSNPAFDPKGEYLYFVAHSEFTEPQYEDVGSTFVYHNTGRIMVAPIGKDVDSPFLPKSDEENTADKGDDKDDEEIAEKEKAKEGSDAEEASKDDSDAEEAEDDKPTEEEPMQFVWDDFERRVVPVPVTRGSFKNLAVNEKRQLIYLRADSNRWESAGKVMLYDVHKDDPRKPAKEETVIEGARNFSISADGKKLLVVKEQDMTVVDAAPDQKWEHLIDLSTMQQRLYPQQEWAQILRDVWRRHRDYFYVPNMHGVDWDKTWEVYSQLLPFISSRGDLQFVIAEMISELNVGHAYIWGGEFESEPDLKVGTLGADFSWDGRAYRIDKIYAGASWDYDARGPLSQPGAEVKEGEYLLAINDIPLTKSFDPWLALAGLVGKTARITVSPDPELNEQQRHLNVRVLDSDTALRYRAWIEQNRKTVEEKSNGLIGYIHVPDTGVNGQNELFRQFYGQVGKAGLIIDERWNGGGQLPHRFVELLNRPVEVYWARRDGLDWATPYDGHHGPKVMLTNGLAGSGGDAFPYLFRKAGLGTIIGTRTWGGLVGITSMPGLIDGGYTAVPTFGVYSTEGNWIIEGHGVDPDIEVMDDPALTAAGGDPQLEAAINYLLEQLKENPPSSPGRPSPPDRSGFGIDPAHR